MDRVLVVDDLPEVRRRIAASLEGLAAEVLEASNGVEAAETLSRVPAAVVVTDVRMPRMGGLELLRILRKSDTPVILHSGHADVGAAVEALKLGAIDFFPAPLDLRRLRKRVEQCLDRQSVASATLVGHSAQIERIRCQIERVAAADDPVLITGETGVGKEVVARSIHAASRRREGPFVAINLGALAEGILESELFGHERGSFTGATARRTGRFEQAEGGTLLLDEIGDAPFRVQTALLRAVETKTFERVGGAEPILVDLRILAASHRDLPREIAQGSFREDLWFRLSAFRIHVPSLRDRPEDIDALVRVELDALSAERGSMSFDLDEDGYAVMRCHRWPGNVRELRLAVRRMAILAGERRLLDADDVEQALHMGDFGPASIESERRRSGERNEFTDVGPPASRRQFEARERAEILKVLNANRWNVSAAARALGISRGALRSRIKHLRLGR